MRREVPAVSDAGVIYCLCRSLAVVRDHRTPRTAGLPNFVVAANADGTILWQRPIRTLPDLLGTVNCEIYGAPRVISGPRGTARIIFVVRYTLMVEYPELGRAARDHNSCACWLSSMRRAWSVCSNRYEQEKLFVDAHGGGGLPGSATLGDPSLLGLPANASPYLDTPVVFGSFPARVPWKMIVAPGKKGLYRFRWSDESGALAQSANLFALPNAAAPAVPRTAFSPAWPGQTGARSEADTFTPYVPDSQTISHCNNQKR